MKFIRYLILILKQIFKPQVLHLEFKAAIDGSAQVGMASIELKDDEASQLKKEVIAMDGIAIITNKANQVSDLSMEQVKNIFSGKLTDWAGGKWKIRLYIK